MNRTIYKQGYIDGFTHNTHNEDYCHADYKAGFDSGRQEGFKFAVGREVLNAALLSWDLRGAKTTIKQLLKDKATLKNNKKEK